MDRLVEILVGDVAEDHLPIHRPEGVRLGLVGEGERHHGILHLRQVVIVFRDLVHLQGHIHRQALAPDANQRREHDEGSDSPGDGFPDKLTTVTFPDGVKLHIQQFGD